MGIDLLRCRYCDSISLNKKIQIFRNDTKHLYVKCKDCKKQYYESSGLITPDLPMVQSKKRKKEILYLVNLLLGDE